MRGRKKERGEGEGRKKIRLPDIIVLLGNSVPWQTELLIGVEQFRQHLTANNLHSQLQSAYKQQHSTETAVLKVKNDILMSMDEQHVTLSYY